MPIQSCKPLKLNGIFLWHQNCLHFLCPNLAKTNMRNLATPALLVFGMLGMLGQQASANPVVYQHAAVAGGNQFASQNDPGGNGAFAKVYDNFTLAAKTLITDVHWVGGYFNPVSQGPITSFLVQIWSDVGGPGAALMADSQGGVANETLISAATYSYDIDLTTAFVAEANTTYWLSIQPTLVFPPQWGWAQGTGGDDVAYQDIFGNRNLLQLDLAFSLTGTTVPQPASLALVGLALAGLLAAKRRKPV